MADFSANDPFHVELEKLSRTIWAPGREGTHLMTHWFYERARGQYADAHASERTPARQRQFKTLNPLSQKFTKTDLAKFENTWDQLPHVVSLGAEKNFREFTIRLRDRRGLVPDIAYFQRLAAKALLFRAAEKIVGHLNLGGYRSQTVTYTLALMLHQTGQRIDLDGIWRRQTLSSALAADIERLGPLVHAHLLDSAGTRNVSEWAKKPACWHAVGEIAWEPSAELQVELARPSRGKHRSTNNVEPQEILTPDEAKAMSEVVGVSAERWFELSGWAKQTNNLAPWQRSLAFSIGRLLAREARPSRKQALQGALALAEARRLGFRIDA
jgi:hypothetical protein